MRAFSSARILRRCRSKMRARNGARRRARTRKWLSSPSLVRIPIRMPAGTMSIKTWLSVSRTAWRLTGRWARSCGRGYAPIPSCLACAGRQTAGLSPSLDPSRKCPHSRSCKGGVRAEAPLSGPRRVRARSVFPEHCLYSGCQHLHGERLGYDVHSGFQSRVSNDGILGVARDEQNGQLWARLPGGLG